MVIKSVSHIRCTSLVLFRVKVLIGWTKTHCCSFPFSWQCQWHLCHILLFMQSMRKEYCYIMQEVCTIWYSAVTLAGKQHSATGRYSHLWWDQFWFAVFSFFSLSSLKYCVEKKVYLWKPTLGWKNNSLFTVSACMREFNITFTRNALDYLRKLLCATYFSWQVVIKEEPSQIA